MADSRIVTGDPLDLAWSGNDHSICPECGHERVTPQFSMVAWVRMRVGFRALPPRCPVILDYEEAPWAEVGPECGCRALFHSS
ncbi:protein of unknown function [Agreia sp. COWG]|nr:protein of unknown function [Agreia sp. COWG]